MDSSEADTTTAAARALSRLTTLSYQQKQMVKAGELLAVLDQVASRRRWGNVILLCGTIGFAYRTISGAAIQQWNWFSLVLTLICAYTLWARHRAVQRVREMVLATGPWPINSAADQPLLTELQLRHRLSYDQHQMLKAGQYVDAARDIAKNRRADADTLMSDAWRFCIGMLTIYPLIMAIISTQQLVENLIGMVVMAVIVMVAAKIISTRKRRVASKLERLANQYDGEHNEQPTPAPAP